MSDLPVTLHMQMVQKKKEYPIVVGQGILLEIAKYVDLAKCTKLGIITDENVAKFWLEPLQKSLPELADKLTTIILPPGEEHKNLQSLELIWGSLSKAKFDRHSLLIALGGGVVGDLAGFGAATYMRGIDFIQIPTTIIAQADSSVGGKTGLDFLGQKNNLGAFWQPKSVLIDVQTLKTLPEREYRQGLAEVIKHGLIADKGLFEEFSSLATFLSGGQKLGGEQTSQDEPSTYPSGAIWEEAESMVSMLVRSLKVKKAIVESDELETTGQRKLLNFGHTLGHAIESLSWEIGQGLLHGEAIAVGMAGEAWLSFRQGFLGQADVELIRRTMAGCGLPTNLSWFEGKRELWELSNRLLDLIQTDKKNVGSQVRWTLLKRIGEGVADCVVSPSLVEEMLEFLST